MAFVKPSAKNTCQGHNFKGFNANYKTKVRITLKPINNCGTVEGTINYLLHNPKFSNERPTLFNKVWSMDESNLSKNYSNSSKVFLFGEYLLNDIINLTMNKPYNEYYSKNCYV